jgi:uncharacterized repeat protein (TIGR01451 family)
MAARHAALTFTAVLAAVVGCSYNPSYAPYLLPPGPIEETHAKPRAFGYFRDFDPKACRLEVTPNGTATAPLEAQIVLVATVYDKDGQPRRDRRVEWILQGPGYILEADESGLFAGRGYKSGNNYAVTYTSYVPKNITRGNKDPKDDVPILPGQTFIVLSSAVAGESVVTAYAPAVYNWDNNRVVTKVLWGDSRFKFPPSVSVRAGGETILSTTLNPNSSDGQDNLKVRYRLIDGPTAVLVPRGGNTTSLTGADGKEAEALPDGNGVAAVRLMQHDPKQGISHVAVEVLKPSPDGTGPGTVVGRRETSIEWGLPEVKLAVTAPPVASALGAFPVTVALNNAAAVDSKDSRVRVALSNGAALASSEPPPNRVDDKGGLLFDVPPVNGRGKQEIVLQVRAAQVGDVTIAADVVTADGMQASGSGVTRVEKGKLMLVLEAPPVALTGDRIPVRLAVSNGGAAAAQNVTIWAQFDQGLLSAANAGSPVELAVGTIDPGQTKTLDLGLTAKAAGHYGIRGTATGDGNISAAASPIAVDVRRAALTVSATGPQIVYLNQSGDWTIAVANRGDSTVSNLVVRATLPPELQVTAADGGTLGAGSVEWKLSGLSSGEQKSFKLSGTAQKLAPQTSIAVAALGDVISNGAAVGTPVSGKATAALAVIGSPALALELATPPGVIEVGKRVSYQVRVKNQGTVIAHNIDVTATVPPELKAVSGTGGPSDARIDSSGIVTFPTVAELPAGQTLTLTIVVDAVKAGDARMKAEVKAAHLKATLKEEQSTRITSK